MTTRTIVTSHPGVACDLCGRRLLRGERPDVFLGGGQRRTVCELCSPRAAHEGWQRESTQAELDHEDAGRRGRRPARGRSLLGRIGWRSAERSARPTRTARREPLVTGESPAPDPPLATPGEPVFDTSSLDREWDGIGAQWAGPATADFQAVETALTAAPTSIEPTSTDTADAPLDALEPAVADYPTPTAAQLTEALEIFNASEHPRRIAGVARALGAACLKVAPLAGSPGTVAIVVAWELCWYRYEVDLDAEVPQVRLAAEGMELEELPSEDRVANAAADERGELALLAA